MKKMTFTKSTLAKFAHIYNQDKKMVASILNLGDSSKENKLAAMFAAAPDMLEALKATKVVLEKGGDITDLLRTIEKAIKKAETVHDRAKN